jgi:hypothetical protein
MIFLKTTLKGGLLLLVILGAFGVRAVEMMAQESNLWMPQEKIPIYKDSTEEPPFLIADQNRTVHAFNSQALNLEEEGSQEAVFYRQWTPEQGWGNPNDIIIDREGRDVVVMDVYFDKAGTIHLVLQIENNIFYAKAPLQYAGQARAWSRPYLVGEQALPAGIGLPFMAAIAGDEQDNLAIIYSGKRDGNGIYAVNSADNGDSWSEPAVFSLTYDDEHIPAEPRLLGARTGKIHAVWNVFDEGGIGVSGYYAQFDTETQLWSQPIEIDEGGLGLGIKFAALFEYGSDLFMTYYQGKTNGNWWRRSSDGGLTWSEPAQISPIHSGTNGHASFVIDSDEELHLFFGERIDDNNHGMWNSTWTGQQWTDPEAVVRGPQVKDDIGGKGFDPRSARAVVVNGNLVLVAWGTDGAAGINGAWYSYKVLDTPELPKIALAVSSATQTATPRAISTTAPSMSSLTSLPTRFAPTDKQGREPTQGVRNPGTSIIIGLVPVTLLILLLIAVRRINLFGRN